jgi:hypothetical protein
MTSTVVHSAHRGVIRPQSTHVPAPITPPYPRLAMRRSPRYPSTTLTDDRPRRRAVTLGFFGVFMVFAVLGSVIDPHDRHLVGALDLVLAAALIPHRYTQHLVTGAPTTNGGQ